MGFEKFNCGAECIAEVERIAAELPKREAKPYENLSRTPFETLWMSPEIKLNGELYVPMGWGEDVHSHGYIVPACILAIRKDIAAVIDPEREKFQKELPFPLENKKPSKPLMGPDWKPAPGFERI